MCLFSIGFGVCLESRLCLGKSLIGCTEILHKITVVKTSEVVAGCVLESKSHLLALILFPITTSLKPSILQGVCRCTEISDGVILCGVIHLNTREYITVSEVLGTVKGALRRREVR